MSVFRTINAIHFPLYLTALALIAAAAVLRIVLDYSGIQSVGYGTLMVIGFWTSQGLATLINRTLGYGGKNRSGSLD